MSWYSTVSLSIAKIPECIQHYNIELEQAKKEIGIWGSLEKSSAALPGQVEHRFNQLQEIEAILEYLNIEKRRLRSQVFKKFQKPISILFHQYFYTHKKFHAQLGQNVHTQTPKHSTGLGI